MIMDAQEVGRVMGKRWFVGLLAGGFPLVIYWLTAHRTITWWDSAQYSLTAITLGIPGPPGSLVGDILGWLVTRLPLGMRDVFTLNLLAGVLAATTVTLVAMVALRLTVRESDYTQPLRKTLVPIAIALGALPLAFGGTLWSYATRYTPYVLTAFFTALIVYCLVRWRQDADNRRAARWLFLIALLVGLDFSVHRTNAVLIPGILLWVLIRSPGAFVTAKAWLVSVGGLLLGLSLQLLLIPIAAKGSFWVAGNPDNLRRFWDYVSLKQAGGGFLISLFPRKADFFTYQVWDFVDAFAGSFAQTTGMLTVLGALPLILGVLGVCALWRRDKTLAIGLATLFLTSTVVTIVYFNIPANFFRSLHRHYLPCLVIFAVLSAYGAGAVVDRLLRVRVRQRYAVGGAALTLFAIVPTAQVADSYHHLDRSRHFFAYDFARNMLASLPKDAILFTGGDNDTFPLWYLQGVEGVRTDVDVVNIPLTNSPWFIDDLLGGRSVPLTFSEDAIDNLARIPWQEDTVAVAVDIDRSAYRLPDTVSVPDSIQFIVPPTAGDDLLVQDQVALNMIKANQWQRPIYVATSVSQASLPWLRDYLRFEGLVQRLMPIKDSSVDTDVLHRNVLETYSYRGYADSSLVLGQVSVQTLPYYYYGFRVLAERYAESGDSAACDRVIDFAEAHFSSSQIATGAMAQLPEKDMCE